MLKSHLSCFWRKQISPPTTGTSALSFCFLFISLSPRVEMGVWISNELRGIFFFCCYCWPVTLKITYFQKPKCLGMSFVGPLSWTSESIALLLAATCDLLWESPFEFPESAWNGLSWINLQSFEEHPHNLPLPSEQFSAQKEILLSVPWISFFSFLSLAHVSTQKDAQQLCDQPCNFLIQIMVLQENFLLKVCLESVNSSCKFSCSFST